MMMSSGEPLPPTSGNKKYLIWVGAVVLVGIAAALFLRSGTPTPQGILPGDQNSLAIRDQDPDAVAVLVDSASVREPAFIIIHEDLNGAPGPITGVSALLQPGTHTNVTVIMRLKPGAMYHGMFHADDGNGLFDANMDKRHLMDNAGREVGVMFRARLSSSPDDIKG